MSNTCNPLSFLKGLGVIAKGLFLIVLAFVAVCTALGSIGLAEAIVLGPIAGFSSPQLTGGEVVLLAAGLAVAVGVFVRIGYNTSRKNAVALSSVFCVTPACLAYGF